MSPSAARCCFTQARHDVRNLHTIRSSPKNSRSGGKNPRNRSNRYCPQLGSTIEACFTQIESASRVGAEIVRPIPKLDGELQFPGGNRYRSLLRSTLLGWRRPESRGDREDAGVNAVAISSLSWPTAKKHVLLTSLSFTHSSANSSRVWRPTGGNGQKLKKRKSHGTLSLLHRAEKEARVSGHVAVAGATGERGSRRRDRPKNGREKAEEKENL